MTGLKLHGSHAGIPLSVRFKFSIRTAGSNLKLSLQGMFENRTLVDLLRFNQVVQARGKTLSGIPSGMPELQISQAESLKTQTQVQ